jgi:hypothetical protein
MTDSEFEDLNTPDMLRHVVEKMNELAEDSPEQVVYISRHLTIIAMCNHDDVMDIDSRRLTKAAHALDRGV